ncbi:MAG: translation elongation factor Ts, partial [Bacteroidota bacterium]
MAISAQDVKKLREQTGVGMMDCKKALVEADGDFDKAVEILRKKGQKVAAKRADREATEGAIVTATTEAGDVGVIAEVNSETDFVARNDEFVTFAQSIADALLAARPASMDDARASVPVGGQPLGEA